MSNQVEVWLLCLISDRGTFPNLSVLGVFATKERAEQTLRTLPRDNRYNLYRAYIDTFCGFFTKDAKLKDGMGQLYHEHYEPDGLMWDVLDPLG